MTEPETFRRSAQADATLAGGRAVIYHREKGHAITLNEPGTMLWMRLQHPTTRIELETILRETWPAVDEATARRDVEAFLVQLRDVGLLETV